MSAREDLCFRAVVVRVSLAAFCLFCGCRSAETGSAPADPVFFPPPPERPRLQFLTSFSGPESLGAPGPGGFEKFVLGEAEPQMGIATPYGLALSDGKLYVCDVGRRQVEVLDLEARSFSYLTEDRRLMNPVNIEVEADGTKYVTDPTAGAVFVFDKRDTLQAILGKELEISPIDVAVRGPHCYVTDFVSNQVIVLDKTTGQEVARIGEKGDREGQFGLISDLTFGPAGDLYVTDRLKAQILQFDPAGTPRRTFGRLGDNIDELVRPKGIAIDEENRIWVVDASTEVGKIYDEAGRLLLFFGLPGNEPGMMNLPASIILDRDNVDRFGKYAVAGADIEFLVLVSNQYGPHKVSVYGFGDFPVPSKTVAAARESPAPSQVQRQPASSVKPPPVPTEADSQTDEAKRRAETERIAQVYYQSMALYRAGHLKEARAGFAEVLQSGLIPPPMEETLRGYLRDIDARLEGRQNLRP